MTRSVKKKLVWGFWGANAAVIVGFWLANAQGEVSSGDAVTVWHAIGRLLGLLATFCALAQFIAMGRVGWLEPIFGLDRLAIFHRRNGIATLTLIVLHSGSIVATHTLLQGLSLAEGSSFVLGLPFVWLAAIAEILFIFTVGASIIIVRRHLRFETWYGVHLLNYLAIALVPFHQLTNGVELLASQIFKWYWIGLYLFVLANVLIWRLGRPLWLFGRYQFRVERIVAETPSATSVYITGKSLERFRAKGGQFVLVRFLDKQRMWQEHPFSLSQLPNDRHLRLTIRQLGDFTNSIPHITPGTPVMVSGPFGAFTHELQVQQKVVYIAGGIGITPIRAMIEERAIKGQKDTAILLYGNRTVADTALMSELTALAVRLKMKLVNVLSDQANYKGEKGYIDKEKIIRLVPDVRERDVFLCGPPPMMTGVKTALQELGVAPAQVHYERFAFHKD